MPHREPCNTISFFWKQNGPESPACTKWCKCGTNSLYSSPDASAFSPFASRSMSAPLDWDTSAWTPSPSWSWSLWGRQWGADPKSLCRKQARPTEKSFESFYRDPSHLLKCRSVAYYGVLPASPTQWFDTPLRNLAAGREPSWGHSLTSDQFQPARKPLPSWQSYPPEPSSAGHLFLCALHRIPSKNRKSLLAHAEILGGVQDYQDYLCACSVPRNFSC